MLHTERAKRLPAELRVYLVKIGTERYVPQDQNADPKKKTGVKVTSRQTRKKNAQDENIDPESMKSVGRTWRQTSSRISLGKNSIRTSKLHVAGNRNISAKKGSFLAKKYPVLQDRTNTSHDLTTEEPVQELKKPTMKSTKRGAFEKRTTQNGLHGNKGKSSAEDKSQSAASKKSMSDDKMSEEDTDSEESRINLQAPANRKSENDEKEIMQSLRTRRRTKTSRESSKSKEDNESNLGAKNGTETKQTVPVAKRLKSTASSTLNGKTTPRSQKFLKNKETGNETKIQNNRTTKPKNSRTVKKTEVAAEYKSRLKQTTLMESFGMTTVSKRLRPRREMKNYLEITETSMLLEKHISPAKRDSFVLVERIRIPEGTGKSAPVYKNVRMSEDKTNDENKIYEFKFDANDPSEKLTKKKRRRVVKKPAVKKVTKKPPVKPIPKTAKGKNQEAPAGLVENQKNSKSNKVVTEKLNSIPCREDVDCAPDFEKVENIQRSNIPNDSVPKQSVMPHRTPLTDNAPNKSPKPKVVSVANLKGEKKISIQPTSKSTSGSFQPFRATNVFKSLPVTQQKNMMDHSLLNKTFSPIKNILDSAFKPDSPWRPPPLGMFSQIKQIYQSTPQPKKQSSFFGRITLGADANRKTSTLGKKMKNIVEENNENVNVNVQNRQEEGSPSKASRPGSLRDSGAGVISEANQCTRSPGYVKAKSTRTYNQEPVPGTSRSFGTVLSENTDLSQFDDDAENKENAEPNIQSTRKSPSKHASLLSTQRKQIFEPLPGPSGLQKKVFEPVPGPSGLQKSRVLTELKVSKQSNLNNFLNLDEMPESTFINTSHGIFADVNSSPLRNKPLKKVQREPNVDNAFGFDDDSSENGAPPLESNKCKLTPVKKILQPKRLKANDLLRHKIKSPSNPARISLGEIKKILLPAVLRDRKAQEERLEKAERKAVQDERVEARGEVEKVKEHQEVTNPVSFYDTFDLMSNDGNSAVGNRITELPLFADLEPVHFSKPPKSSYSRQSFPKRSFSEDDDEEDEMESRKYLAKKRKVAKTTRKAEKKLNEWARSINDTFQEIEEFDLVVERLP